MATVSAAAAATVGAGPVSTESPRLSLRQRKHAATITEIKEVALRQMAADSAASLSPRSSPPRR